MHHEINLIRERMAHNHWPQYLRSVQISGLRGWAGQEVRFDFPVTVIAGENGTGKSTVLKVAACAYGPPDDLARSFYPSTFFPDTAWEQSVDVALTYNVRQGPNNLTYSITKPSQRWRRMSHRRLRRVIWQDIARTLPLEATAGFARIAKRTAIETATTDLNAAFLLQFASVLGRQYQEARMAQANIDPGRRVGVVRFGGQQFSQFHQGAGEDATLDLMTLCQNVPNHALVLIDEVEASLHPRSQRRLIHFLFWLARIRHVQVILSTHSGHVLEELPLDARVFLGRGAGGVDVLYEVSSNFALNRMDDPNHPELFILTEDTESGILVTELLRYHGMELTGIRFLDVGPADVVRTLGTLSAQNRLPFRAVCIQDGDQQDVPGSIRLPGNLAPERQVFRDILQSAAGHLATRMEAQEHLVVDALNGAMALLDHHLWTHHAANALSVEPTYLWATMARVWVRECLTAADRQPIIDAVNEALP